MGVVKSNLLSHLKGSFGNIILYEVDGQLRIRSKMGMVQKIEKQPAKFYHKLEMPMYMTWCDATRGQNISGYNLFIKGNTPYNLPNSRGENEMSIKSVPKLPKAARKV